MNTLYYDDNLKVCTSSLCPTRSEAFKKAGKTEKSGPKQEGLGI